MARYVSALEFSCPLCRKLVDVIVEIPEPDWAADNADDRARHDEISVTCPRCDSSEPVTVSNFDGSVSARFDRFPPLPITASPGYTDEEGVYDYDEYEIPQSPSSVFYRGIEEVKQVIESYGSIWGANAATKMVFSYYFSVFEAYLSDALARHLMVNHNSLSNIVLRDKSLSGERVKLHQILHDRDIVWKIVKNHLGEISYHNFARVEALYRSGPGITIWPNDQVKERLYDSLPLRHDIVHRNGVDKDGKQRDEPNRPYLTRLADDMTAVVTHIDRALAEVRPSSSFDPFDHLPA